MKIAVIGAGYMGHAHARAYSKIPDTTLVAVADADPIAKEFATLFSCKAYPDIDTLFRNETIDLASICVPTYLHEQVVMRAAEYGVHVVCEKPVSLTTISYKKMLEACRKSNTLLMAAQAIRWRNEYRYIRQLIHSNGLGDVRFISAKRLARVPVWAGWHADPERSGGGLYNLGIHDVDFFYHLLGKPERVFASGWKSPSGSWDHVGAQLVYENGLHIFYEVSLSMSGGFPLSIEFSVDGSQGSLVYQHTGEANNPAEEKQSSFRLFKAWQTNEVRVAAESLRFAEQDALADMLGDCLKAVKNEAPPPIAHEEPAEVLRIMEAITKSCVENCIVELP